jgi:hypothetical protein
MVANKMRDAGNDGRRKSLQQRVAAVDAALSMVGDGAGD